MGNSGSAIALMLGKLGARALHLWDDDCVELRNLPSQILYDRSHLGTLKVHAAAEALLRLAPWTIVLPVPRKYTGDEPLEGVVIAAVDSMAARGNIWQAVKSNAHVIPWYFDCRIGGEFAELFTLRPCVLEDTEVYEAFLFSDNEAMQFPCGADGLVTVPMCLAALMAAQLGRILRTEAYHRRLLFALQTYTIIGEGQIAGQPLQQRR
jgi:hypothetical protein